MVAVLAWSHTRGGLEAYAIASPTTRVESSRDVRINSRFDCVYRQSTLRPARLITTSAPSNSSAHSFRVRPSHAKTRHGAGLGLRLNTTTSCPATWNAFERTVPDLPLPPG